MTAPKNLWSLISDELSALPKKEKYLLEAELFLRICRELKEIYRNQNKEFFNLINLSLETENEMLETNFLRLIIHDILSTDEYNLQGIAHYTDTPEEVIQEVATGKNTRPSAILLQRTIELHRHVRPDVYNFIIKKITSEYLAA